MDLQLCKDLLIVILPVCSYPSPCFQDKLYLSHITRDCLSACLLSCPFLTYPPRLLWMVIFRELTYLPKATE